MRGKLENRFDVERRRKVQFVVSVSKADPQAELAARVARTVDISDGGARLTGIRLPIEAGDSIVLQHGTRSAKYSVVWVRGTDDDREIGVEIVGSTNDLWCQDSAVAMQLPLPGTDKENGEMVDRSRSSRRQLGSRRRSSKRPLKSKMKNTHDKE